MTVVNRQARRAGQAPAANPYLKYDPVADIPNEQGQLTQPQPAIPGGGPQNQLAPELQDPPQPEPVQAEPEINDVRMALALRQRMKEQGMEGMGEVNYRKARNMLMSFEARNPGLMKDYDIRREQDAWYAANLDTTPAANSRLIAAQREASGRRSVLATQGRDPGGVFNAPEQIAVPKSEKDLPPIPKGSRAEVLDREEKAGLDTMTGVTNIIEELNFARKVNGSEAQFQMMYGMVQDRLENAGIQLPRGVHPVSYNEDLGQLEALVPTEEGKVRRVLVDSEFLRLADLGKVGDIEELMAMTGAVLSQLPGKSLGANATIRMAQRHPAIAEAIGDFGWRNTGVILEALLDAEVLGGDTSLADLTESLQGNASESFWGTVAGRVTGRLFGTNPDKGEILADINQYTKGIRYPEGATWMEKFKIRNDVLNQAARDAEKSINDTLAESAETLEELHKLTDGPFQVDRGAVSGSLDEAATQGGREARLSSREQREIDIKRQRNKETLDNAVENVHTNNMPTNPARDPRNTDVAIRQAREDYVSQMDDIEHVVSHSKEWGEKGTDLHIWSFNKGTNEVKGDWPRNSGARVRVDHDNQTITMEWIGADEAFANSGPVLLDRVMTDVFQKSGLPDGYRIISDDSMSRYSVLMMKKMAQKEGFTIVEKPHTRVKNRVKQPDGTYKDEVWYQGNAGEGVFEVTEVPGYMVKMPVVGDYASYSKSKMASVLDSDLEHLADLDAKAQFWGVKQDAQIGWQKDRQKSLYSIVNPKGSQLNRFATQLQQRVQRSLTGADVSKADATLGSVFVKTVDEEGNTVLAGLTSEELDMGHLLRSRDTLAGIAERTGDREVSNLVDYIDNILYNGKMVDARGVPVDTATQTNIRATMGHARESTQNWREAEAAITSNALFKQNSAGEFINTDLKTLETAMGNGSKFWLHTKPWMEGNPEAQVVMKEALGSIYQKNVLDKGWTMSRHRAFFDRFGHAADELWGPEEAARLKNTRFSQGGANPFKEAADKARSLRGNLDKYGPVRPGSLVDDFTSMANTAIDNNANKVVQKAGERMTDQQVSIGSSRVRAYLADLDKMNPQLSAQMRANSLRETQLQIRDNFLTDNVNKNPLTQIKNFEKYINDNEAALVGLHGAQYVKDLRTIQNAMALDGHRFKISGAVPELQGDVVRVSRTLMGPLSVFQRRVSAANWVRLRFSAAKALDMLADPAAIRQLNAYKGYSMRSRPVIAFLARTGMIPGTSWDGKGEMPREVYAKGLEFAAWLEQMDMEMRSSEKVEQ